MRSWEARGPGASAVLHHPPTDSSVVLERLHEAGRVPARPQLSSLKTPRAEGQARSCDLSELL